MTIYSKINENNIIGNVTIEKINDAENIKISGNNHLTSYCRQLLKNKVKIWFGRNIPKVRFPQFPTLFSLALLNKPYVDGNEVKENDIISIKVAPQATNSSNASSSKVHWVFDFEEADGQGNIESVVWRHVFGNILFEHTFYNEYNYSIYIGGMCFANGKVYVAARGHIYSIDVNSHEINDVAYIEKDGYEEYIDYLIFRDGYLIGCFSDQDDIGYYADIFFVNINTLQIDKELIIRRSSSIRYRTIEYDGQRLIGSNNGFIHLINPDTGEIIQEFSIDHWIDSIVYLNGKYWVYYYAKFLCTLDINTGQLTQIFRPGFVYAEMSAYGNNLIIPNDNGYIIVFDTISERIVEMVPTPSHYPTKAIFDGTHYWIFCDDFESIVEYGKPTYGITSYYNLPTPIVKTSNDIIRVTYDFLFT